jgi:hypothetical protein
MPHLSEEKSENTTNGISNLYDRFILSIHRFLVEIKKNIILFIICIGLCIGGLYYISLAQRNYFKSSFTVSYDDLVRKIYGDRLEKINVLVSHNNYDKVSKLLGISVNTSKALIKIKGTNILGQNLSEDMNTDRIPFIVTITVNDSSKISAIQDGIVNFLEEGNNYMAEKKGIKNKEVLEEIEFIDKQMRMMDTLKQKYNQNSINETDIKNPNSSVSTIYQFSYEMYKRRQELERKKSMPSNVQVLDDAIAPTSAKRPMAVIIFIGFFLGFALYTFTRYLLIPVIRGKR